MQNPTTPSGRPVPATRFQANLNVRFPPLPRTATEVARLLSDDTAEPNLEKLIEIVHADPIVTQLVLRRINSAYYGCGDASPKSRRPSPCWAFWRSATSC